MNKKLVGFIIGAALVAGGGYWYLHKPVVQESQERISIINYNPEKHKTFIQQQFKENWYWLISSADYNVNYMLDTHSPNTYEPQYKGKMNIVVIEENGVPAGFGTYYMRSNFQGEILFIEVAKAFRGKRLAAKLVNYAVTQLKKMGATIVKLATRVDNKSAQKLYNRLGFPEVGRTKTFVHYRKEI